MVDVTHVRPPAKGEVEEFIDFLEGGPAIPIPELKEDFLYSGVGGDLGRIAIFRGIDPERLSPMYESYGIRKKGDQPKLIVETDHRKDAKGNKINAATFAAGTFFQPNELMTEVPANLKGASLIDWLITQDLIYLRTQLAKLEEVKRRFGKLALYESELVDLRSKIRMVQSIRTT